MKASGGDTAPTTGAKNSSAAAKALARAAPTFFPVRRFVFYLVLPLFALFFLRMLHHALPSNCALPDRDSPAESDRTTRLLIPDAVANSSESSVASPSSPPPPPPPPAAATTGLRHIVFGIAASASLWDKRKEYIKLWWRPRRMRGHVWLDKVVGEFNISTRRTGLPALRLSGDTSSFPYTHRRGSRSAIRISRIVSESFRLNLPDVRWFVMGDDDTVFIVDNLLRVLNNFDYRQPYYIGSLSESHLQNIYLSYGMAYGGGGFAISRPLAAALSRMQDGCLRRYPALYGSDDRIQACMAELGVPLTRHPGFHQFDVYGDLLGLLAAHPVAPLISLHHLDVVQPVFPGASRVAGLRRLLEGPVKLDSAAVMQQSVCYESGRYWTVGVSWGFAVTVARGVVSPREMEMPARTFLNWYRRADYTAYAFNTRPVARNSCQRPRVYYMAASGRSGEATVTTYSLYSDGKVEEPACRWMIPDPARLVDRIDVVKRPDPTMWDKSPRRNCCRVVSSPKDQADDDRKRRKKKKKMNGPSSSSTMTIDVGPCRDGEFTHII